MNNNYISLIALVVAVFFSGIYLRGESARKSEIKRELDLIKEKQAQIIAEVDHINETTIKRDSLLVSQIDSAQTYIRWLNLKESMTANKLAGFGENIENLQADMTRQLTELSTSQGLSVASTVQDDTVSDE